MCLNATFLFFAVLETTLLCNTSISLKTVEETLPSPFFSSPPIALKPGITLSPYQLLDLEISLSYAGH